MRIFHGMLDQAILNARGLLKCKSKSTNSKESSSAIFCLERLSMYLIRPYLTKRYDTMTLRRDLELGISAILGIDVQKEKDFREQNFPKDWGVLTAQEKTKRKRTKDVRLASGPYVKTTAYCSATLVLVNK